MNLNHCQTRQDLLAQKKKSMLRCLRTIQEPLLRRLGSKHKAAVWACGNQPLQQVMKNREHDFVRLKIDDLYIYSAPKKHARV